MKSNLPRCRQPRMRVRWHLIAVLFAGAVVGCSDSDRQASPTTPATRPPEPHASVALAPGDLVPTPAGWRYHDCVHEVPNGAHVDIHGLVKRPDGSSYQLPQCAHPGRFSRSGQPATAPIDNGWIEWAAYSTGVDWGSLSESWHVPANPTATYSTSQTYYTFPGIQSSSYIIQPVLTYGYAPGYGGNYWTGASWHCNDGSNCTHGPAISMTRSDSVIGSITATGCSNGICTWTIVTADVTQGTRSSYAVDDTAGYYYAVGGALEVYNLGSCSYFPADGVFYTGISLRNQNNQQVTPSWGNIVIGGTPDCGFDVSSTSSSVSLIQNPPPPLTASISGPSTISTKGTYSWTANASGGTGSYSYQWSVYYYDTHSTLTLGTSQSQQLTVYGTDGDFEMRVTVTSGGDSASPTKHVTNCISGCSAAPVLQTGG